MSVKNKKYLIFGIALGILTAGITVQYLSGQQDSSGRTLFITLAPEGFSPREITINKGDTVIWSTTRGVHFWPASDLHPTHAIYSAFDPKEPIEADKTWSFRFDKAGVWKYHDHLAPLYTGVVTVVEPAKNKILGSSEDCTRSDSKYRCWENTINTTLEKKGLDAAFDTLSQFYSADPSFDCHGFAHKLGQSAYYRFANNQDLALSAKSSYCGYGFYHGFMETLLQVTGDPREARNFCGYVQAKLAAETSDGEGACFHGIGHGAVDGGDPRAWGNPKAMIAPGLKLCENVSSNDSQLYRCITGVFNSIEILSADPKYKLAAFEKDPFSLCHYQPAHYREGCYTNMLPALMRAHDIPEIAKIIETTIKNDADYAIRGMVILSLFHEPVRIGLSAGKTDFSDMIALCRSLDSRSRLPCIGGLSRGFMKYGEPQNEHVKALAFCRSSALKTDEADTCFENILSILRIFYSKEKTEEICNSVESKYGRYCKS